MIVKKISCVTPRICHDELKKIHKDLMTISHIQNNHIITFPKDYDDKGNLDKKIHLKCWELGGVERLLTIRDKKNKKSWKVKQKFNETKQEALLRSIKENKNK
tara:strand:+ start:753 stop:1061 length:309 start_codon:yes stop_codon:yes gene_type:complete